MPITEESCSWPRCNAGVLISYSPRKHMQKSLLCQRHWEMLCTDDADEKTDALRNLGYSNVEIREVIHAQPVKAAELELSSKGDRTMATKTKSKSKSEKSKNPARAPAKKKTATGVRGKTLGLKIGQTWAHFFEKNEKVGRGNKMTDAQIQREMRREFPDRSGKHEFSDVSVVGRIRYLYNNGKWGKPAAPSRRYDDTGNVVERGARKSTQRSGKGKTESKTESKGQPATKGKKSFLKKD